MDQEGSTASSRATAGRQLDALVAAKVFGRVVEWVGGDPFYRFITDGWTGTHRILTYSTNIENAWEVVDRLRERGWVYCTVQSTVGDIRVLLGEVIQPTPIPVLWWCAFAPYHSAEEVQSNEYATPAEAICDAALRAMDAPSAVDRSRSSPKRSGT